MMLKLLWMLPVLPYTGALVLALFGGRLGRRGIAAVGCGSVGISFLAAIAVAFGYAGSPAPFRQTLYTWIPGGDGFDVSLGFHLDALSLAMCFTVCSVGFLIHLYAAAYMAGDEGYRRFFTYMNIFVGSMLTLLLADNLVLLYLGWEGVGACSFLLIGFWYQKPENGAAARKAFFTTRVGDAAMAVGVFLLFWEFQTVDFVRILNEAPQRWASGDPMAAAAGLLLLAGACGKSAQIPLQVWLPDAMAGPTPVSALIHAATMVTAGVYLVARTHQIYLLAPGVLLLVGLVGGVTALYAAAAALGQRELKRVLAYSTISQIGYMFLALGVGAFSAAIFHFMTHAIFKALLFLAAGVVIHAFHGENDINKMGGLFRRMPLLGATFIAGSAALAALPLVTSGFYSKDAILHAAWGHGAGGRLLAVIGLITAFLTALYISRAVLLIFFGPCPRDDLHPGKGLELFVLSVLAIFALIAGFVETPAELGGIHLWSGFLEPVFHEALERAGFHGHHGGAGVMIIGSLLTLAGIGLAFVLHRRGRLVEGRFLSEDLTNFLIGGLGFDWLYERLFLRPYRALGRALFVEPIDRLLALVTLVFRGLSTALTMTQSGLLRRYAAAVVLGAVILVTALIVLI